MKKILLALALLFSLPAFAATYYACPCDSGAHGLCSPGSDGTATPTNPNTPRNYITASFLNGLAAGDSVLICQGGAKTSAQISGIVNTNATATNPIRIGTYVAGWGGGGTKPWLQFSASSGGISFGYGDDGSNDGGYIIEGLKLDGGGEANNVAGCIQSYNTQWRRMTIQDNEITGCGIGIFTADAAGGLSGNTYISVLRNSIHGNWATAGIHGSMYHFKIEGNDFAANGCAGGLCHNIYLGGTGGQGYVLNNTFSAAGNGPDEGASTQCQGGNITFHGEQDGLQIMGNRIINASYNSLNCAGIKVNTGYSSAEHFGRVVISGNLVVNTGVGIGVAAAQSPLLQDNVIINADTAINLPDSIMEGGDTADNGAKIINNSAYFTTPSNNKTCINMNVNSGPGTGVTVRGNLCRFDTGSVVKTCFTHPVLASFTDFSRNSCSNASGGTFQWSTSYSTLANAQSAGFDANGQNSDPLLVAAPTSGNSWSMQLQSGSPARAASTSCPRLSYTGRLPSTCSMGAYQSVDP